MPVIPITELVKGWHKATIQGFDYRSSTSNSNPMVVMEVTLDTGELVNVYLMVTYNMKDLQDLLRAAGERDVADQIQRHKNPAFELDDLLDREIEVYVNWNQSVSFSPQTKRLF